MPQRCVFDLYITTIVVVPRQPDLDAVRTLGNVWKMLVLTDYLRTQPTANLRAEGILCEIYQCDISRQVLLHKNRTRFARCHSVFY